MNPHIKSLSITPVINKFPVTFLHNSPCCFHLLPTALEIMPVPFVAGSYQGARMSVLHQATLLLADSYTLPSTNHKIKADFYLLCNNSTIWEQLENLEFSEVIHLSLFVASLHSLFFHKNKIGWGSFHSLVSSYIFVYNLHVLASHFQLFEMLAYLVLGRIFKSLNQKHYITSAS